MRGILKYVAIGLLAVLVFGAAMYLDRAPGVPVPQEAPKLQENVYETTESAPVQTLSPETQAPETLPPETQPAETEAMEKRFVLSFVGDCTLGCKPSHAYIDLGFVKTIGEDYDYPFLNFAEDFRQDDLTITNLEGPLCENGKSTGKELVFRGSPEYVNILTQNSVEVVSLANNHIQDYGEAGYQQTVDTLRNAGVSYVERDSSTIVTTESGLKVGIYAGVYFLFDEEDMVQELTALKDQVDVVIFAPHWGNDVSYVAAEKQYTLAYKAIDAGADIVYGGHPQVLQPIEEYNGGIIYYSLGNFCFGGNIYPNDYDTAMIQQEVYLDSDGNMRLGETIITPARISSAQRSNDYQPTKYAEGTEEYDRVLAKLAGTFRR